MGGNRFKHLSVAYNGSDQVIRAILLNILVSPYFLMKSIICHICRPCMKDVIQNYTTMMRNKILCSGSIVGSHEGVLQLLINLTDILATLGPCLKLSMTDQIVLNHIAYEVKSRPGMEIMIPENLGSPMLTVGNLDEGDMRISYLSTGIARITPADKYYRENSSFVAAYVHQYDRFKSVGKAVRFALGVGAGQALGDRVDTNGKIIGNDKLKRKQRGPRRKTGS
jgi:hypothetical protein